MPGLLVREIRERDLAALDLLGIAGRALVRIEVHLDRVAGGGGRAGNRDPLLGGAHVDAVRRGNRSGGRGERDEQRERKRRNDWTAASCLQGQASRHRYSFSRMVPREPTR